MTRRSRYNPWRDLRTRAHIELEWAEIPGSSTGGWIPGDPTVITIDSRLSRVERNATLAHELVHDERGIPTSDLPPALAAKEEQTVERIVATRLVPIDELERFVARRLSVGPVTTADIAAEFDVPDHLATRAVALATGRRGSLRTR